MPRIKYQDFKFRAESLALIETCNSIIREYQAAGFVLTLRQLYYQLVSRDVIANRQSEYKRVGSVVNDARLAGLIDWKALEDRTRNVKSVGHWERPSDIIDAVAKAFQIDKWKGQDIRPEVWIEKDALVGVIEGVCQRLDISFFSCRGYTSQSEMWEAAMRFIGHAKSSQQVTHVIHLGDHDPSGQDMSRDIEERIRKFMGHHGYGSYFEFTRIALNMDQIDEYQPPPNPAKSTDSRFEGYRAEHGDESWELDALEPRVLADLIEGKVRELRDDELYEEREIEEASHLRLLERCSEDWDAVAEFLSN